MNWARVYGTILLWVGLTITLSLALVPVSRAQTSLEDVEAPERSQGAWHIEALQESDNQDYFHALQSSQGMLYRTLGWGWPAGRLTAEANLDTMRYYTEQREKRRAYTYVLRDAESGQLHGALFISPTQERPGVGVYNPRSFDLEVTFWLSQAGQDLPISSKLIPQVTGWLREAWNAEQVLFPIAETNHFARQQLEQADLIFLANNANNNELLYRFDAR